MRSQIIILLTIFTIASSGFSQSTKFRFDIGGTPFLSIKENTGGFYIIHQNNLQSSMFFGYESGLNTIDDAGVFNSGSNNTAYGFSTLSSNTTGFLNTAIGAEALLNNTTGHTNTAIGFGALGDGLTATDNIGIGKSALLSNISGQFNVAIGNDAFNNTNHATNSVSIGYTAGVNDTSSVNNVYVGFGTGRGTVLPTDGYDRFNNVMIGASAGFHCKTNGNVFLGYKAGMNANADNQLYVSNSDTDSLSSLIYGQFDNNLLRVNGDLNISGLYTMPITAPTSGQVLQYNGGTHLTWANVDHAWSLASDDDVLYGDGDVGIGIIDAIYRLDVLDKVNSGYVARFHNTNTTSASSGIIIQTGPIANPTSSSYYVSFLDGNGSNIGGVRGNGAGGTMYSTVSDRRLKQNIRSFDKGLETLNKISPAIYQTKSNPDQDEIGFIAQELLNIFPQAVGGNPTDDVKESPMTVDYGRLTPLLVAAIKEQQEVIEELTQRLDMQDNQFKEMLTSISKLQNVVQEGNFKK